MSGTMCQSWGTNSTYLVQAFLEEGDGEHSVVDAELHQLGWITSDALEPDTVLRWSVSLRVVTSLLRPIPGTLRARRW